MKNWIKYAVTILVTACITALATVTVMILKEKAWALPRQYGSLTR